MKKVKRRRVGGEKRVKSEETNENKRTEKRREERKGE